MRGSSARGPRPALLGFVKPQLGHLMAALQIDQGRVGKLATVGYEAEIGQPLCFFSRFLCSLFL